MVKHYTNLCLLYFIVCGRILLLGFREYTWWVSEINLMMMNRMDSFSKLGVCKNLYRWHATNVVIIPDLKLLKCCSRKRISLWATCWRRTVICPVPCITTDRPWYRTQSMPMLTRCCVSLPVIRNSIATSLLLSQLLNPHLHCSQLAQRMLPNPVKPFSFAQRLVIFHLPRWQQ